MYAKNERTKRRFWLWLRRWVKTSKPTEWISSVATAAAVFGGIFSGLYLLHSGFLDAKKSEAEVKLLYAKMETDKTEQRKIQLDAIVKESERKLAEANRDRLQLAGELTSLREQLAVLERERTAVFALRQIAQKYTPGTPPEISIGYSDDNRASVVNITGKLARRDETFTPIALPEKSQVFDLIKNIRTLTTLRVQGVKLDGNDIAALHQVPNLHSIELINCSLTDETFRISGMPSTLWSIDLSHNGISRLPSGGRQDLHTLNLSYTSIDDAEVKRLVERFPKLHNLLLFETKISESGCRPLAELADIETLSVPSGCVSDESIWLLCKSNDPQKSLGKLVLGGKSFTVSGVLDLSNSRVTDAGIAKISGKPRYSWLNISGTKITDAGLLPLASLPGLQGLSAANSGITEGGLNTFLLEVSKHQGKGDNFIVCVDGNLYDKYKKRFSEPPDNIIFTSKQQIVRE